jgi:hypothetical protein
MKSILPFRQIKHIRSYYDPNVSWCNSELTHTAFASIEAAVLSERHGESTVCKACASVVIQALTPSPPLKRNAAER